MSKLCVKKCFEDKHVDFLSIGEGEKSNMFLSKISTHSCMITHYIADKKLFVVVVYKLLEQQNQ